MTIKNLQMEYASANGFCAYDCDNVRHVKVLPYLSVVQAVEGDYDIALANGEMYNTGDGGFFVAPSNVQQTIVHHAARDSGRMTCRWVFLQIKLNGVRYPDELYTFPVVLPPETKAAMHAVFETLFNTEDAVEKQIGYYRILQLLLSVGCEKEHPLPPYIGVTTSFIREHYAEKITVQDIAQQVNLSSSHFFAVFKQQMGMSPIAYLNNYRLSMAVDLLLETDKTVTEIAASVGIPDTAYFNKMFKKSYQLSPTAYRKRYKA